MQQQPVRPLIIALAVAMAPLVLQLPIWAIAWCGVAWTFLLVRDNRNWPVPSRMIRTVIFITGMAAVLLSAGLRFDGSDFIALLAVMAGLKPLEINSRRDRMVTVFLAYFLVITSLFVFENLSMILYLFVSVWVTTGVLIHVNDPNGEMGRQLGLAARLVLTAIPLMLLLFFLFPRLSGSFWGSPWARHSRSGFSSTMRIGDVSRLALVDEPAFTVSFDAATPSASQLYWRGIVFQRFDGRNWLPSRSRNARLNRIAGGELSRYTVMLEPHGYRHLFVLDLPLTANPVASIMGDHTLVALRPIRQRFNYGAASFLDYRHDLVEIPDDAALQLPPRKNPLTVALGKQWSREHTTSREIVDAALDFFRQNGFVYTLRPDRLGPDAIDDFLFTSRNGFCEHYAAAFAVLMRAAGVPTRIVGGYQGGRWNELGGFLTVRQSDAHAWCEVWLADQGWKRVDPTFAVSPERIDAGIESALAGEWLPGFLGRSQGDWLTGWIDGVQLTWEALNTRWDMWFMGFSAEDQIALLHRLGISAGRQVGWMLFMALPPLFIVVVVLMGRLHLKTKQKPPRDEALKIYARFLDKMERVGLPKAPHQGPMDYARSVARQVPALKHDVDGICCGYILLRYGREESEQALQAFHRRVRRFRPGRYKSDRSKAGHEQ